MLLQRLREYSQRFEATPSMYVSTPIRWLIDLHGGGTQSGRPILLEGEGKRGNRGKEFLAPHVGRSSGINPKLLADRADYVLGISERGANTKALARTAKAHGTFIDLVRECAASTREPSVNAVLSFLEHLTTPLEMPEDMRPADNITFRVGGVLPIDLQSVRQFWAARQDETSFARGKVPVTQCLICGRPRPPATRHRIRIKGIPGGQPSGMTIVSANKPAFESYGLRASHVAPVCAECAEAYANGTNYLIRGEHTHYVIGPLMYLFWTRDGSAPAFVRMLRDPEPDEVKALLRAAQTGREGATEIDDVGFYATALSASGGRVVVREWLETTVGEAQRHLRSYFARQRLVGWDGKEGRPIGLFPLLASLVLRPKELPPDISVAFLRHALSGGTPSIHPARASRAADPR